MDTSRPFIYLFIVGIFHLFWGLGAWVLFALGKVNYPSLEHARAMNEGFLLSFAAGFILTFIPRTTRTHTVTAKELSAMISFAIVAGFSDHAALLGIFVLTYIVVIRLFKSPAPTLPPFLWAIVFGLASGATGLILKIFSTFNYKPFLYEGMLLFWLIGVGSFLLPMIRESSRSTSQEIKEKIPFVCGFIFIGLAFESIQASSSIGPIIKLIGILFAAFHYWHISELPRHKGYLSWGIWLSTLFVALGSALKVVSPNLAIHWVHITFIMGYTLVTLMVATRVSIAHGNGNFQIETSFQRTRAVIALILLAGLTRISVAFLPEQYVSHLAYAAVTLLVGVSVWISLTFPIWRKYFIRTKLNAG